ncbi:hypothetical protein GTY87_36845 [Streptomyces sp. SID7813]|uniref:Uncharacterized protein n=1 Tax=Streptomyces coelicolor (strain ATCC BAA-471 / A3(2) / M145) TaxID=100226 RepID=Q9K476_STRCO|nr:hypothetical protein [Streptomyces sp. SID7813]QFI46958.1 hypothetical protein FQ762_37200 [Streptomyces coelicolor A3(2)]CAB94632.1 hypothetical protein SC2H12.08c [Streptomyces coelicolor A3(2)]
MARARATIQAVRMSAGLRNRAVHGVCSLPMSPASPDGTNPPRDGTA